MLIPRDGLCSTEALYRYVRLHGVRTVFAKMSLETNHEEIESTHAHTSPGMFDRNPWHIQLSLFYDSSPVHGLHKKKNIAATCSNQQTYFAMYRCTGFFSRCFPRELHPKWIQEGLYIEEYILNPCTVSGGHVHASSSALKPPKLFERLVGVGVGHSLA